MVARNTDNDRPLPRVVSRPAGPPPPAGGPGAGGGGGTLPFGGNDGGVGNRPTMTIVGGQGGRGPDGQPLDAAKHIAQQTAQQNVSGAMPFNQTPGMQIASQRISGEQVRNDPAISAALQDFYGRVAPQIQNRATMSGLGRSTAALNSLSQAQASMLAPMYESAFGREADRLNRLGVASENELGRRERSAARVADANQNMVQQLMGLSNTMYGRQQGTAQNLMAAGGQLRDIEQAGNQAELNDFLRRQALGEQAVYAPFGGLAQAGLGSTTSQTGK